MSDKGHRLWQCGQLCTCKHCWS